MKVIPTIFEDREIRRLYDEKTETWFFSVVDIVQILTQQPDYKAARNYWKVLKNRLAKEGSQLVTNCNQLKLPAADGKKYLTDVANAETLLRLVQSVQSQHQCHDDIPPAKNLLPTVRNLTRLPRTRDAGNELLCQSA